MFMKKNENLICVKIALVAVLIAGIFGTIPVRAETQTKNNINSLVSSTIGGWYVLENNGLDGVVYAIAFIGR